MSATPLWLWLLAITITVALLTAMTKSGTLRQGWMFAVVPLMLCLLWPVAQGFVRATEPLDAYEIDVGPCPGVVDYKEMRETSRKSVRDITAAFILNGWGNITVHERGHDGFWSSTYSVVAARCPSAAEGVPK